MVWVYIEDIDRLTIIAIIISMIILRQQLAEKKQADATYIICQSLRSLSSV